ncbi:acyl-coenzyme A synthetase/AMP-(fatty) acid ligase [Nocardioides sp. BE266]|uniref:AMP-binding protein n=1 Tax=Nocardioides sp. BE266 TaxID=2817725 RepID=UPI00285877AE|nr:AMP-binding protein [Nocardioides sp. BE266]MDR7253620.1 acyl-coenzyme A synthetase/AMP-(fatty) acid ligase [Nocardioides sp. BE266]
MADLMGEVTWFRAPSGDDPGLLNACYNALDLHVIRGRADEVAASVDGTDHTFAWLLTEVAACAGVLRAFGIGVGDRVVLGSLPAEAGLVGALAVARIGAVASYDNSAGAEGRVILRSADSGVVFAVDGEDLPWDVAMRAGRTDPAPTADVPGDAVLARHGDDELRVLAALGASDDQKLVVPRGASVVEVGGLRLWSFDTP